MDGHVARVGKEEI